MTTTPPTYTLQVRAPNLTLLGEIDGWEDLHLTLRQNKPGAFSFTMDNAALMAPYVAKGNGIVVLRNGTPLLSGPFRSLQRSWSKDGDVLTVGGPDDLCWINERYASPVPSAGAPPYSAQAYDVRTGVASTIIRQFVDVNAGPSAAAGRAVPGLTLAADPATGSAVTGRARFNNLLELCQALAIAGGDLGFTLVQAGAGLVFTVYAPVDRTATAVFSPELGNLLAFSYRLEAPTANALVAGDNSTGVSRVFYQSQDAASIAAWGARIEAFLAKSDTSSGTEIYQAIAEQLGQQGESTTLAITPIDTDALQYGRDYNLGDRVTVDMGGGVVYQDVVREIAITVDTQAGEVVSPVVGTNARVLGSPLRIFQQLGNLARRTSLLDRT